MSMAPASAIQVWDLQPISTAVAMVATVLGASFRFSMCPDIWLSSSTAYLNMKGTITLVIWKGRERERGRGREGRKHSDMRTKKKKEREWWKRFQIAYYADICLKQPIAISLVLCGASLCMYTNHTKNSLRGTSNTTYSGAFKYTHV